jgi:hypothetical protein
VTIEEKLSGWTGPSSATEREKQERAERMVREAVRDHQPFQGCGLKVFAKGSYANNTNVRSDSDVDIAVKCTDVMYWDEHTSGAHPSGGSPYTGVWTPSKLRSELSSAMTAKFPGQVDTTGSTAIHVDANSARVEIDVVPCFDYRYYFSSASWRDGSKVFKKDGSSLVNYSDQQLANGIAKNNATNRSYKRAVRILKRLENAMVDSEYHREVPSYLMECLVYNTPNQILNRSTWKATVEGILHHIWSEMDGPEPSEEDRRWLEVNECKFLFFPGQPWSRTDARDFAYAGWNYLELGK